MQLFELFAKFVVDKQDFDKDMASAEKTGEKTAGNLTKSFDKLKKVLIGIVSVAAAKRAASALMNVVNAAAQVGDAIDKQSQALGMSRQAYQEWEYILAQSGASIESLGVSMKTLNTAIESGSSDLAEVGLSIDNLQKMSQEDAFAAVVDALQALPASARKSSLAMKLLGKNGQDLMPLLNGSAEDLQALRDEAERLGLYMSDEGVDASVAYGDALDAMKRTFRGVKQTVATAVMPTLTNAFKVISDYAGNFHKNLKTAMETGDWAGLFSNIWTDISGAASDLWIRISDTVPQLWSNIQEKMGASENPVLQAVADIMGTISGLISEITDKETPLGQVFDTIKTKIDQIKADALEKINGVLKWIAEPENAEKVKVGVEAFIAAFAMGKLIAIFSAINPIKIVIAAIAAAGLLIYENWDGIQKFFEDLWTAVKTAVTDAWNAYISWIDENIVKNVEAAWAGVQEFFTGLWSAVTTAATEAWTAVSNFFGDIGSTLETAWAGVKEFFVSLWADITNGINMAWNAVVLNVQSVVQRVKAKWNAITSWFQTSIIQPIKDKWNSIVEAVTGVVTDVENAWKVIVTWFQETIIDPITSAWNSIVDAVTFWKPKDKTMTIDVVYNDSGGPVWVDPETGAYGPSWPPAEADGNNAKGLSYVPYDNYVSRLHRGEMVLNKSRADAYRDGSGNSVDAAAIVAAVSAAVRDGLAQAEIVMDKRTVGAILTPEINKNMADGMKSRRFATA